MQYDVFCHICGHQWAEQDPGVRFILTDHVWECAEMDLCFGRQAMARLDEQDAMRQAEARRRDA